MESETESAVPRLCLAVRQGIPKRRPNPVEFGEQYCRLPGSAMSERFKASITPWVVAPLMQISNIINRIITFVKPVQCGGSVVGEIALMYFICWCRGFVQYNWTNDKKAIERWSSRFENVLKANKLIKEKLSRIVDSKDCEIDFGNAFFRMQGVLAEGSLDSDSVRYQVNEEIHTWQPGDLDKAHRRSTALWNYLQLNISNAGKKGDQLHQALLNGTNQAWEVKCLGCSNPHHEANSVYHIMKTRFDFHHPEDGGLRYDADKSRLPGDEYNYNILAPTLRYQMPCGYVVRDDVRQRRALSLSGHYGDPRNKGAHVSRLSYTLEAVAVDYISWLDLIMEMHRALKSRRLGDLKPWHKFTTERECLFFDPDTIPVVGRVNLTFSIKKNRKGLEDKKWRFFSIDAQRGEEGKGEFPHYWLLIRDFNLNADSLLVFEQKVETEGNLIHHIDDHECMHHFGVMDSGDGEYTTQIYLFCLQHGINAIKGSKETFFAHQGQAGQTSSLRIFSQERPLHKMINRPSKYPYRPHPQAKGVLIPDPREPLFWRYSKHGIRERLNWFRAHTQHVVPSDVSRDYREHNEAEEKRIDKHPTTGEEIVRYIQLKSRNDLYVCEAYVAMQAEMAGIMARIGVRNPVEKAAESTVKVAETMQKLANSR